MYRNELKQKLLNLGIVEQNEYLDKYCELIEKNLENEFILGKHERHHIIPRSYYKNNRMFINSSKENLVVLTYGNHFIAHYYLMKCGIDKFKRNNLIAAMIMSKNKNIFRIKDEEVEKIAEEINMYYQNHPEIAKEFKRDGFINYEKRLKEEPELLEAERQASIEFNKQYWTENKREEWRQKNSGRIMITNGLINKMLKKEEANKLISTGLWRIGNKNEKLYTINGETHLLSEWGKIFEMSDRENIRKKIYRLTHPSEYSKLTLNQKRKNKYKKYANLLTSDIINKEKLLISSKWSIINKINDEQLKKENELNDRERKIEELERQFKIKENKLNRKKKRIDGHSIRVRQLLKNEMIEKGTVFNKKIRNKAKILKQIENKYFRLCCKMYGEEEARRMLEEFSRDTQELYKMLKETLSVSKIEFNV